MVVSRGRSNSQYSKWRERVLIFRETQLKFLEEIVKYIYIYIYEQRVFTFMLVCSYINNDHQSYLFSIFGVYNLHQKIILAYYFLNINIFYGYLVFKRII
jgi:hypothetical protein